MLFPPQIELRIVEIVNCFNIFFHKMADSFILLR